MSDGAVWASELGVGGGRRVVAPRPLVAHGQPVPVAEQQLKRRAGVDGPSVEEVALAAVVAAEDEDLVGLVAQQRLEGVYGEFVRKTGSSGDGRRRVELAVAAAVS